mgnify:FL=1
MCDGGFSLDASVRIEGWDRQGLERVLRYCARPPFALERIEVRGDAQFIYHLPKPTPDGGTVLRLTPLELISRIAALVPAPGFTGTAIMVYSQPMPDCDPP